MNSPLKVLILTLVLLLAVVAQGTQPTTSTPVEIWCGGDDGLTMRLRATLEKEFAQSRNFTLSCGKKAGTLVVTIPSNVEWKEVRGRTQVVYTVEFTSVDNRNLATRKGHCWGDALTDCAAQILKQANAEARNLK